MMTWLKPNLRTRLTGPIRLPKDHVGKGDCQNAEQTILEGIKQKAKTSQADRGHEPVAQSPATAQSPKSYHLVGECYVERFMEGLAISPNNPQHTKSETIFTLVSHLSGKCNQAMPMG